MQTGQPSRTALGAAVYRAAHQTLEGGRIFSDPLARTVLGPEADALITAFSLDADSTNVFATSPQVVG